MNISPVATTNSTRIYILLDNIMGTGRGVGGPPAKENVWDRSFPIQKHLQLVYTICGYVSATTHNTR